MARSHTVHAAWRVVLTHQTRHPHATQSRGGGCTSPCALRPAASHGSACARTMRSVVVPAHTTRHAPCSVHACKMRKGAKTASTALMRNAHAPRAAMQREARLHGTQVTGNMQRTQPLRGTRRERGWDAAVMRGTRTVLAQYPLSTHSTAQYRTVLAQYSHGTRTVPPQYPRSTPTVLAQYSHSTCTVLAQCSHSTRTVLSQYPHST